MSTPNTRKTTGTKQVPVPPHVPEESDPVNSDTLLDIGKRRASKDDGNEVNEVSKAAGGQPASAAGGQRQTGSTDAGSFQRKDSTKGSLHGKGSSFVRRTSSFTAATAKLAAEAAAKDGEFELDADDLAKYREDGGLEELDKLGGLKVLIKELHTNAQDGLGSDELQTIRLDARKQRFGENKVPRKDPATFLELIVESLEDFMVRVLIVAGVVSLILETVENPSIGWINGVAILLAVAIVALVTATNNYQKEKQFRALEDKEEQKCVVVRNGGEQIILAEDVLVGDIMVIKTGDAIIADALFISGADLAMDEAALTGESDAVKKSSEKPIILSGSSVMEGEAVCLVFAVGVKSMRGSIAASLEQEVEDTPLQQRLEILAEQVGKAGTVMAVIFFVVKLIMWIVKMVDKTGKWADLLHIFIVAVTLIVVAVPEGLPLAVTISLAYSMQKMFDDNNMVRVLSACETMGNATAICSDKTGTLTQNKMTVVACVIGSKLHQPHNGAAGLPSAADIPKETLDILVKGEALNSKVFVVPPSEEDAANAASMPSGPKLAGGNQTACACLRWAISLGCDFETMRKTMPIEKAYPFNSKKKTSSVLVKEGQEMRMFVKGASENIVKWSTSFMNDAGKVVPMTEADRQMFVAHIGSMAKTGLRCIGLAFQDFSSLKYDEKNEVIDPPEGFEAFTLMAILGIKDPLRPAVPAAMLACKNAGIVVRMVTGDHLDTAKFIAKDAGIMYDERHLAIEGPSFRNMSDEEKEAIVPKLRVLARSSPLDKEILVRWLKAHGDVVAVTGDGTNDAPALKAADVGLAMGIQGTDYAKQAASIVILDDNFATIVRSVMWGRSVYDNIKKFVQFQLTVNVVALTLTLIGAFSGEQVPLTAVQLLWVNLIMDTGAALAFGTEMPTEALLDRKPYAPKASLISPLMIRNIVGQSILQITVLCIVLFRGDQIWGVPMRGPVHLTIIFNTFVFLQVWNEFNSRKVNGEWNIFEKFFDNWIFTYVLVGTLIMQTLMVEVFGSFASTTGLTWAQWLACIGLGFLSLPTGVLVRLYPVDVTAGQIHDPNDLDYVRPVVVDVAEDVSIKDSKSAATSTTAVSAVSAVSVTSTAGAALALEPEELALFQQFQEFQRFQKFQRMSDHNQHMMLTNQTAFDQLAQQEQRTGDSLTLITSPRLFPSTEVSSNVTTSPA